MTEHERKALPDIVELYRQMDFQWRKTRKTLGRHHQITEVLSNAASSLEEAIDGLKFETDEEFAMVENLHNDPDDKDN